MGTKGKPTSYCYTPFVPCRLGNKMFHHALLLIPHCPTCFRGRDLLGKLGTILLFPDQIINKMLPLFLETLAHEGVHIPCQVLEGVTSPVCNEGVCGRARYIIPIKIQF